MATHSPESQVECINIPDKQQKLICLEGLYYKRNYADWGDHYVPAAILIDRHKESDTEHEKVV